MNLLRKKLLVGICLEAEGEEDLSKPRQGQFWRKQKNVSKHGARQATKSDGGASKVSYIPNGKKDCTSTATTATTTTGYAHWTRRYFSKYWDGMNTGLLLKTMYVFIDHSTCTQLNDFFLACCPILRNKNTPCYSDSFLPIVSFNSCNSWPIFIKAYDNFFVVCHTKFKRGELIL
jgi:hypothetical protein